MTVDGTVDGTLANTLPVSASGHGLQKPQRVLACVLCQQRKIKCNRRFPCSNCTRARIECVPATLAPRRKRRPPPSERELLDRIRSYEHLLRQNKVKFEPFANSRPTPMKSEPPTNASAYGHDDSDYDLSETTRADFSDTSDDEADESVISKASVRRAFDQAYRSPESDHLLLGGPTTAVDLSTLHPEPVQIFRLWQIYLDNVDPLLKVTHTPTLQGRIIEAAGNVAGLSPPLEALMFAIYCIAVVSVDPDDCPAVLGAPDDTLLRGYRFGCRQALSNCGFLQTADRECLTALFLYLISVGHSTHPRPLSSMLGVAMRIAQRMGLHHEAALARCTALEAEQRRRLWWALVLFDSRTGEMADAGDATPLTPTWDCRVPLNANDSELRPEMAPPPPAAAPAAAAAAAAAATPKDTATAEKPTEAIFAVMRAELGNHQRFAPFYLDFVAPALKPLAHAPGSYAASTAAFAQHIEAKYLQSCDAALPLHYTTMWMARGQLAKLRMVEHYAVGANSGSSQLSDAQRDAAMEYPFAMLHAHTQLLVAPRLTARFAWLVRYFFPFPAYVHIVHDLRRRPLGALADRAWRAMTAHFAAAVADACVLAPRRLTEHGPIIGIFGRTVLQAWAGREEAAARAGLPPTRDEDVPGIVREVRRQMVLYEERKAKRAAAEAGQGQGQGQGHSVGGEDGDRLMGGLGREPVLHGAGAGAGAGGVLDDMGGFHGMGMSVGLGSAGGAATGHGMLYGGGLMGVQAGYPSPASDLFGAMSGQGPLDVDPSQLDWGAMRWG
ncbi:hypothetical protein B0T26DRAFT_786864 [Lasiosphaeria miniovina]|uniref:Zn(2)-C6 fungal-type domain-containing protein n=1 Tax=Lasiosphaeria miniovina TaxID=1954250 RepID=A0AA40DQP4_9PEZI|nr:uncharacterized protein B0T26DRAFT_786864 [Lasiosphaeria miniovina]KAK0709941.1 hypothetical protein B0T26DRAFT_786864 [Lasiosphaeria miniovina]